MLNIVARTLTELKETVLLLEWRGGRLLGLYRDGRLAEFDVSEIRADRMEAEMRIATNERDNVELFSEVAADAT